jgi:predicted dehydrogenase
MKKLPLGIIGAGGIAGGIHLPALAAIPEAELRAVCDLRSERAEEAAKRFGIGKTYVSYHDMLRDGELEGVFVLVPPDGLFRAAADALLAGKHVFMEKPMGISAFQARSLRDLAAREKRVLHTGFNRRFIPLVGEITRKFLELAPLTHVEGRFYKNSSPSFYGGCAGSFICDVIHVIDLVRHIAAGGPGKLSPAVRAATLERKNPETGLAEAWFSSMEFANGVSALVRADYRTGGRVHQFELHGPGASAYIDLGFGGAGCSGRILASGGKGTHSISAAGGEAPGLLEFDGPAIAGSAAYEVYYGYAAGDRCFIKAALDNPGGDPSRTGEDAATMELAEQLLAARIG